MATLPRPLLAALVLVAAFFAVWTFMLKPGSSGSSNTPAPSAAVSHPAVPAHKAVAKATAVKPVAAKPVAAKPAGPSPATLTAALNNHKVVALLFYNPAGADDLADRHALTAVSTHGGRVVRMAVPVTALARFSSITDNIQVTTSPTLIVIDAKHQATTLSGFADPLEYNQLVASALATK